MEQKKIIETLRAKRPLVHHLTNVVTVNDCANMTLALGGAPVMTEDDGDALEMVGFAGALVINMGTLDAASIERMVSVGKKARKAGVAVVFDPVGAGATQVRRDAALRILKEVKPDIVKGNGAELLFLAGEKVVQRGVDSSQDAVAARAVVEVARKYECIAAATGSTDYVSDGKKTVRLEGGHELLSRLTGTGCMTASLVGCCAAVEKDLFSAAIAGILSMKSAGERAAKTLAGGEGVGHFRVRLFDAVGNLDDGALGTASKVFDV